jgi:hypothetical protein
MTSEPWLTRDELVARGFPLSELWRLSVRREVASGVVVYLLEARFEGVTGPAA